MERCCRITVSASFIPSIAFPATTADYREMRDDGIIIGH
jgi:hypothetical protein